MAEGNKHYQPTINPGLDHVIIKRLHNFFSIETVIYTTVGANITDRNPEHLADLAIESAKGESGASGKDGISYLMSLKKQGIRTPMMSDYAAAILKKTDTISLEAALEKIKKDNS